jgi:hypothetical protein
MDTSIDYISVHVWATHDAYTITVASRNPLGEQLSLESTGPFYCTRDLSGGDSRTNALRVVYDGMLALTKEDPGR